ncbi:MAG: hypothetical protein ACJ0RF_09940 [Luminiphilus sp.]
MVTRPELQAMRGVMIGPADGRLRTSSARAKYILDASSTASGQWPAMPT